MKVTPEGLEATTQEIIDWMRWYYQSMRLQIKQDEADAAFNLIKSFMKSGERFSLLTQGFTQPCEFCQGKGISRLTLAGETKPRPCMPCAGLGMVKPKTKELVN